MKIFFLIFTAFTYLSLPCLKAAESYLVMEAHSNRVLLALNSEKKRPVAGLVKIAAAKVTLDWAKVSQASLTSLIVVPETALTFPGTNPMGLRPGDRISIRDAIYSSMLGSDHMAMHALADHIGRALLLKRQKQGDPQKTFVDEMRHLAKALGMRKTKFVTPTGMDLQRKKGYSTAADMARLCVHVMRDPSFVFYVKQKSRKLTVLGVDGLSRSFTVANTNQLLEQLGVNGIRTGLSASAGQCLAVNSHKSPLVTKLGDGRSKIRGRDLIVIILGSSDRFAQGKVLIAQGWAAFDQWGSSGYTTSESKREYLIVPQL